MDTVRNQLLLGIKNRARRRIARLASELVKAGAQDREAVQAGIEFERWLADSCWDVLDG